MIHFVAPSATGSQNLSSEQSSFRQWQTLATVRDLRGLDGCGFVFELADGKRLEPFRMFYCGTPPIPQEQIQDPLINFEFVDGKQVKIGYEVMENQASICMVGSIVKITCIEELAPASED